MKLWESLRDSSYAAAEREDFKTAAVLMEEAIAMCDIKHNILRKNIINRMQSMVNLYKLLDNFNID